MMRTGTSGGYLSGSCIVATNPIILFGLLLPPPPPLWAITGKRNKSSGLNFSFLKVEWSWSRELILAKKFDAFANNHYCISRSIETVPGMCAYKFLKVCFYYCCYYTGACSYGKLDFIAWSHVGQWEEMCISIYMHMHPVQMGSNQIQEVFMKEQFFPSLHVNFCAYSSRATWRTRR